MKTLRNLAAGAGALAVTAGVAFGTQGAAAADRSGDPTPQAIVAQQFTLRLAANPGEVANVRGAGSSDGVPIIQYPLTNAANERWELDAAGGSYYTIKSVSSGKCVNVAGGGTANGTEVIQYTCGTAPNELWRFVPAGIGYQVVDKSANKCLNVAGGLGIGHLLIQYDCTVPGAPNDVWLPVWEPNER
ncbi:RICIN domain-containing protein [Streptomyces sp. NRRL F-5123]|uniref:RICIN domain-containing protein n=1 Tax=Streptomyces sp. NRRL F-5123 TaxID=1463856 RepID=UPI000A9F1425|nr:RICIN domain-containing protein [Streptomyces sp. NRRL F-5123]